MSRKDPLLAHTSLNNSGHSTILLVHGGGSTRHAWDLVTSHLPAHYHLLIPDLRSHGAASSHPFSLSTCTELLSQLIVQKAHDSIAHIVGLSIGAYVAIDLAVHRPDLVNSVFASGYNRLEPSVFTPFLVSASWYVNRLPDLLPKAVVSYFMDGADLSMPEAEADADADAHKRRSYEQHKELMALLTTGRWPEPWRARTVIVAATKGGLVPSYDKPAVAKQLVEICRRSGNEDVRAVQHRGMRHPWNAQDPNLFADAVCCFIERRALPAGFEDV